MNDQEMVLKALRISASAQVHLCGCSSEPSQAFPSSWAATCAEILSYCQAEGKLQALERSPPNPEYHCLKSLKLGFGHL